ncbi:MAG: ABC transporter ATP-binding protein [Candidatus Nanopelagicales bacterium]
MTLLLKDVTVSFGAMHACEEVSLIAPPGRVTTVVGANGAGKSTLLRACAGLVRLHSGSITLDGVDLADVAPADRVRRGLGFVPEGRATISELSVEENLLLGGLTRPASTVRARVDAMYDLFPALAERRRQRADVLSGGERQQLAIARALMAEPKALLLDEPSLGLAPLVVAQILELVNRLSKQTSMCILLVEQNAAKALHMSDHAYVLSLGRVVAEGPAAELASDSRLLHAYLGVA